jgi:tripartite-type tricarboxylate transporter receptor subunit TctC
MFIVRSIAQGALLMLVSIGFGAVLPAHAQPFPSNVIRIVVPTGPGTPPDIISRVVAAELSETEGWRMLIENRPGALQTIGMADVLKQPPDGYSIYPMSVPTMAVPALLPSMGLRRIPILLQSSRFQSPTTCWS